ncbi:aspartate/glutamate racemase family protein [Pseudoxanthomonas sp. CAU 1598]|uniref:Aspartate/glutamate racemase family protein n=2 Tax=Pseudomarimonas arenosa TaxID=2774145 RepID=A0AAW3ZRR7_9GAMM|nr:aspartate/glutamate racemase family protein [Pseudomarimonas arenosa]
MKRLGLLGGMSWESTLSYYRLLNQGVGRRLGGLHSADLLLHSVDFALIEALQTSGDWCRAGALLADSARILQSAGASALLLCTNTMHKVSDAIESAVSIPLLHIADATGQAVHRVGHRKVGLLGTRFTMEEDFYRQRLVDGFGLQVITPDANGRAEVDRVIYQELCRGRIEPESRLSFCRLIKQMGDAGAEAVILGCTEIGLLVGTEDSILPLFDTTSLHVDAALDWALSGA